MTITLQGLTPFQKMLCDVIWQCETQDQVLAFRNSLPNAQQRDICDVMIRAIMYEYIDQHIQTEADCAEAQTILSQY
jgi:hypothetical protein